jgi:hypothetical protein
MSWSWMKPAYWISLNHPEGWSTLMGCLFTALGTLLSVAAAAYLTYRYTKKHSEAAHDTQIRVDRLRRNIDALEKIWELLAYMSFVESDYAIVRWRLNAGGDKEHFFHWGNLKRFIGKEVSDAFYCHHAGLFMPAKIRDQLFHYRSLLIGLSIRYENDGSISEDSWIKLENQALIKQLAKAFDDLNEELKNELNLCYQLLSINNG